ncbi:uncharacterized protein At3g49055-like isoform X2 [Humulus lupulus]|uniref:uncharacterized protein At3g49055-like isoform X2 n=1 Tax=Humulus lupulus TaxID=3486 RepID=UPI002B4115DF|nr:uncharacterized protein At3g49055-like isoform X2 [Humulus lupulus]
MNFPTHLMVSVMENPKLTFPEAQEEDDDQNSRTSTEICTHLHAETESLHLSKSLAKEESLTLLQNERNVAVTRYSNSIKLIAELSSERGSLQKRIQEFEASTREKEADFAIRMEEEVSERKKLEKEVEIFRERIEDMEMKREQSNEILSKCLESLPSANVSLERIIKNVAVEKTDDDDDDGKFIKGIEKSDSMRLEWELTEELLVVTRLASEAEEKVNEYKELRKKEKRELENSVVSLTEENRDINSLLRAALLEKEAVEKRLKVNSEQKRVALLQIAERGLQRVGFGFMMGSGNTEQSLESFSGTKSDSSECEEEVVSLASTVERIMKNLRLEITKLRRSLEESRSDTERLQSLTEKQAQTIEENKLYIKELEERERVLTQNVEEFLLEIKETEAEVARWREACELEVEAGKAEIQERDKVVKFHSFQFDAFFPDWHSETRIRKNKGCFGHIKWQTKAERRTCCCSHGCTGCSREVLTAS